MEIQVLSYGRVVLMARSCELMGLYILHILGEKYQKHRITDDRLPCFEYTSIPQTDRIF